MPSRNAKFSDCEDYHNEEINWKSSIEGERFNDNENSKEEFNNEKIKGNKSDSEKYFPSELKQIAMESSTVSTNEETRIILDAFDLINEENEAYNYNINEKVNILEPSEDSVDNNERISSNKKEVSEFSTESGSEGSYTKLDDDDQLNERNEAFTSNNIVEVEDALQPCEGNTGCIERTSVKKKKGTSRKSKLNALDEIHSESQRLVRQSRVSLPYHRPKQRSLADFLNRQKPVSVPLKAAQEKLSEVWQQIEQREKLAEKFFNSESDESEDESFNSVIEDKKMATSIADFNIEQKEKNSVINNVSEIAENEFSNGLFKMETGQNDSSDTISDRLEEVPTRKSFQIDNHSPHMLFTTTNNQSNIAVTEILCYNQKISITSTQEDGFLKVASSAAIFADSDKERSETPNASITVEQKDTNENVSLLKKKLKKIPEVTLINTPKISGSSDDVIVLDEDLPKTGTLHLKKRFMKHLILKRKNEKKAEETSVLSSEVNEKGEIIKIKEETISINNEEMLPKLGKKLVVLKATLQQQMAQLREQQLAKRVQDYKFYEDEIEPEDKLEVDTDEKEEEEEFTENETESESEEELIEERKEKKVKNPFLDDEAEVSQDEDLEKVDNMRESDPSDEDSDKREGDLSDEDSFQEQQPTKLIRFDYMPKNQRETHHFSEVQNEDAMDNLLELCSGNFTSQALNLKDLEANDAIDSQAEELQTANEELKNTSSNESDSEEEFVVQKNKIKKKLHISDDEEEVENTSSVKITTNDENDQLKENEDSINGENVESSSDDDEKILENEEMEEDEEDELARKISKEFLDGEAELSGSDWESADEDERYLDEFEDELGDEDKISERKLQRELGKIHFKEVMANDKREVRLLQELLLEDGELHSDGPKRQRIFRWYNDDNENRDPDKDIDGDECEINLVGDEDDETWRKTRLEREKFLREKNIDNLEDIPNNQETLPLETGKQIKCQPKLSQNLLISPDPKQQFRLISKRGSFLNRSEKILNKLAQISTNTGLNENPIGSSKGKKNMVFAVISPPKIEEEPKGETLKRKSDVLITAPVKKLRFSTDVNVRKKISFLEKLKDSDLTSN